MFREGLDRFGSCQSVVCLESEGKFEATKDLAHEDMAQIYETYVHYEQLKETITRHGGD